MQNIKATLYRRGEFLGAIHKIEVRAISVTREKYAQYESAVRVEYIEPRQRHARTFVDSHKPSVLVLDGWGHPDPDSAFGAEEQTAPGVTLSRSRYLSCDPRWQSDFDAKINAYLAEKSVRVIADMRGVNTHEPVPTPAEGAA